ncbi:MAG: tRNA lysidine(34) synthetase TilS, partial [Xanthomonadaceae bacterium]|nr:tRNA lysidine(34) synthetase TilS [Xanthomonadaceae bacterium]
GHGRLLRLVHIDHGLDAESAERAARAIQIAEGIGIDCRLERVQVDICGHQNGPESAARQARYARLRSLMHEGDHLLTAHHADDQVETLLLRLLRGSGPGGLAAMRPLRRFGPGWLARPLLHWSRERILSYLTQHRLDYQMDPSNQDLSMDRNYLRHQVLPVIKQRWPAYRQSILQSRDWLAAAAAAVDERARDDFQALGHGPGHAPNTLNLPAWSALDDARALSVIRHWCRAEKLAAPPGPRLLSFRAQCRELAGDRQPLLDWCDGQLHAHAGRIWLDPKPQPGPTADTDWDWHHPCELACGGRLLVAGQRPDIEHAFGRHWRIGPPANGERLRTHSRRPRRTIAELLRHDGIPPWRRDAMPCLRIDGRLQAVGPDWLSVDLADWLARQGIKLTWQDRPDALKPCRPPG